MPTRHATGTVEPHTAKDAPSAAEGGGFQHGAGVAGPAAAVAADTSVETKGNAGSLPANALALGTAPGPGAATPPFAVPIATPSAPEATEPAAIRGASSPAEPVKRKRRPLRSLASA